MASNTKDFIVNILADTKRFLLNGAEKELENLGDAAKHSGEDLTALSKDSDKVGKDLKDLGHDADKAGSDIKDLGHDADATAKKVDSAFDKIASSSKSNLRGIKGETDHVKKGLHEIKDEAKQSGREAAASFSGGFSDVTDAVQEIGANAFSGLGTLGTVAGGALALTLGFVVAKAQEAAAAVQKLSDTYFAFMTSDTPNEPGKQLKDFVDSLDPAQLQDWGNALDKTGISKARFFKAMASGDTNELAAMRKELERMIPALNMPWDENANEAMHLIDVMNDGKKAFATGSDGADTYKDALGGSTQATKDAAAAEVDATSAYTATVAAIEAKASAAETVATAIHNSITEVGDAKSEIGGLVEKSKKDGKLTLSAMTKTLAEQTKAAKTQKKNLQLALNEGGADFAAFMATLPAEAAAAYAAASPKERKTFREEAYKNGQAQQDGVVAGSDSKMGSVEASAQRTRAAVKRGLLGDGKPVNIPVTVTAPTSRDVQDIVDNIKSRIGTIKVPVSPSGRNIP